MQNTAFSIPTLLVLAPLAGGLIAMTMGSGRAASVVSLFTAVIQSALLIVGVRLLEGSASDRFVLFQESGWIDRYDIAWRVAFTYAGAGLAALALLLTFASSVYASHIKRERSAAFQGLLWLTCSAFTGLVLSSDLVLFYVFFELMLLPLFVLIGVWGNADRLRATITMLVYTLVGSLPMLVAVVAVGLKGGTFSLADLADSGTRFPTWTLLLFLFAFAVKAPLLPVHSWLPLAYRSAPVEVTAMLSGLISKAAYAGMFMVVLPLYEVQMGGYWGAVLAWFGGVTLLYGAAAAFRQPDARGVVAYSSLAQMGLISMGVAAAWGDGGAQAASGAYLQAIGHGVVSAALFLVCGFVERRNGTGELSKLGGIAGGRPVFATTVLVLSLVALAVPGSNIFAGELLILVGVFQGGWQYSWVWALMGGIAIVFAAMYGLRLLSALMHTTPEGQDVRDGEEGFGDDLDWRELSTLAPLLAAIVLLSVWPAALSKSLKGASEGFSDSAAAVKTTGAGEEMGHS